MVADVAVLDTVSIRGRFLDNETDRPIPGVTVTAGAGPAARSGPDGSFLLGGLPPDGRATLRASAEGLATYAATLPLLPRGVVTDLGDLRMGPVSGISVRVVTEEARVVVDAEVVAHRVLRAQHVYVAYLPRRLNRPEPLVTARTDASGVAELAGLAPGSYEISAVAPGRARSRLVDASTGARTPVTIVLEAGYSLRGTVFDADGRPVGGAEVWAWRQHTFPSEGHQPQIWRVVAGEGGRFALDAVPGGALELTARRPGGMFGIWELVAPAVKDRVELRLPAEGTVAGRAVDLTTGNPVAGVELVVWIARSGNPPGGRAWTRTDGSGRFRVEGLLEDGSVYVHPVHDSEWVDPPEEQP